MVSNIHRFSLGSAILLLTHGATETLAMEYRSPSNAPYASRTSCFDDFSYPTLPSSLKNKPAVDSRPITKNKKMKTKNSAFKEISEGIYEISDERIPLTSENFKDEIELLLKNSAVKYVLIDSRDDYNRNGDKTIRNNIRLIKPWYENALKNSSLTEEQIYKLVWLPQGKVIEDLMNQGSFWPEGWLFSMKDYYNMAL